MHSGVLVILERYSNRQFVMTATQIGIYAGLQRRSVLANRSRMVGPYRGIRSLRTTSRKLNKATGEMSIASAIIVPTRRCASWP